MNQNHVMLSGAKHPAAKRRDPSIVVPKAPLTQGDIKVDFEKALKETGHPRAEEGGRFDIREAGEKEKTRETPS